MFKLVAFQFALYSAMYSHLTRVILYRPKHCMQGMHISSRTRTTRFKIVIVQLCTSMTILSGYFIHMQGEEVAKVEDFKYLGSTVQSNGECGREVKKRVQAGWNGWRRMSGVICDRRVLARVKGKVYRVALFLVRPAMLHGLETVALKKRQEAEMEVAELKMLRFSFGVTRMEKIRNEYIRGTAQVGRFREKTREARLRWYG